MKWSTALNRIDQLLAACQDMAGRPGTIVALRVQQAWLFGDVLGPQRNDLEVVQVALVVPIDVAWGTRPPGAVQWLHAAGLATAPLGICWRPAPSVSKASVGNHDIDRPLLLWDIDTGVQQEALSAVRAGEAAHLRPPAPSPAELSATLAADLGISLTELRRASDDYARHRYTPGSTQRRADALADVAAGYLDLLAAMARLEC